MKIIAILITLFVSQFAFSSNINGTECTAAVDPIYGTLLAITKDGEVLTRTKVVYKQITDITQPITEAEELEMIRTGCFWNRITKYKIEYLILDISDSGEVKVIKRYSEEEWEKLLK